MLRGKIKIFSNIGASLVEAAVVLPAFLVVILGIMDLSNYFFRYLVLSYAVSAGTDLACKYTLESRTDSAWCSNAGGHQSDCVAYEKNVKSILARTEELANLVSSSTPGQTFVTRRTFTHYYVDDPQDQRLLPNRTPIVSSVAFLRPGEKVKRDDNVEIQHPTLAYPNWPIPGSGSSWPGVLDANPAEVLIEAFYDPIIPIIPQVSMNIRSFCFRKNAAFGRPPRPYAPQAGPPNPPPGGGNNGGNPSAVPSPVPTPPKDCSCCTNGNACPSDDWCFSCASDLGGMG